MRRIPGQVARHTGRALHRLAKVAMALVMLVAALVTVLAWRLAQGPMEITWLLARMEKMVNVADNPTRLNVGNATLAWQGFRQGVDRPLEVRLANVAVTDEAGERRMEIPRADLSVSIRALFLGRIVPRTIEIDGARLTVFRAADGSVSLDLGTLHETTDTADTPHPGAREPIAAFLRELTRPAGYRPGAQEILSQIRRVVVRDATVTVIDQRLGATWYAPHADINLARRPGGGVDGHATLGLALGDQTATLTVTATMPAGENGATRLTAAMSAVTPAALAHAAPSLRNMAALDAPIRLTVDVDLDTDLMPVESHFRAQIGPGRVTLVNEPVDLLGGALKVATTKSEATIEQGELIIAATDRTRPTRLTVTGALRQDDSKLSVVATLGMDRVDFADLSRLWPPKASPPTRSWILENITAGTAQNARIEVALRASDDLSDVTVTHLQGLLDGEDLTVHWLRPIAPLDRGKAQLRFADTDRLEITMTSARQKAGNRGGFLTASNGRMVITGLSERDQVATIDVDIAGSVPNAITLMKEPRLHLLNRQAIDFRDPAGDMTARLSLSLPLEQDLQAEDVTTRVTARVSKLHLTGFVAGRDIDQGEAELDATDSGMTIKGRAQLAGIPLQVDAMMDFRGGPASQVVNRATVTGRASAAQLRRAGLDGGDLLAGDVAGTATWTERRNGQMDIVVDADLTPAELIASPIAWHKPPGVPAKGSARVVLAKGQMRQIERITLDGEGISVRGSATCEDGRIAHLQLDRARLGRSDVHGSFGLPAGGPVAMTLAGPVLDMSTKLSAKTTPEERQKADATTGSGWTLDARFDRVLLAGGKEARNVTVRARNDGRIYRDMSVAGSTGADAAFSLNIAPAGGTQRSLKIHAADAGSVLQGLDILKTMEAGTLTATGTFDDGQRGHPLTGSVEITDFRMRQTPGLGKLLQAMTLYGLVDVLRGPGMGFSQLVGPFRLQEHVMTLDNARAFSSSLGLTAKGKLDLAHDQADIEGTIVPAYFFNSMLGNIPLIGKLFSPETGGGVFAARYTLRGPMADPTVMVNPLSALTPGFLREIFGLF